MEKRLTEHFLLLYCEKNSDLTKNLVLKGKDMFQRYGTRIQGEDMPKIITFLKLHPEVISLDLSYNEIGDKGVEILVDTFLVFPNEIKHLNLMWCDITDMGIKSLVSVPFIKLLSLRLNGNKFGPEGGKKLAMLLVFTNSLLHLDVGETDQTLSSVPYFLKLLRNHLNKFINLRVIDISRIIPNFNRYPYDSGHLAESIGDMLQYNKTLIEIHIQKNQLDAHDLELLMRGLIINTNLLMFDIGYNKIGDYGIELIANHLRTRPQLLGLNVAGNGIGNVGARALSFSMPFSRIRLLDIGHNKITDDGMQDILNSIKKPVMMRMLNIWGNKFTHETNKLIVRMIMSQVLNQDFLDVKIYEVDEVFYTAFYPSDRFKHKYYSVMDYACPVELKIKRNYLLRPSDKPRNLVEFKYYPRIPLIAHRDPTKFNEPKGKEPLPEPTDCYQIDFMV